MADINRPKDGREGDKTTANFNRRLTPIAPLYGVGSPIDSSTDAEIELPLRVVPEEELPADMPGARSATEILRAFSQERDAQTSAGAASASDEPASIDDIFSARLSAAEAPTSNPPIFAEQAQPTITAMDATAFAAWPQTAPAPSAGSRPDDIPVDRRSTPPASTEDTGAPVAAEVALPLSLTPATFSAPLSGISESIDPSAAVTFSSGPTAGVAQSTTDVTGDLDMSAGVAAANLTTSPATATESLTTNTTAVTGSLTPSPADFTASLGSSPVNFTDSPGTNPANYYESPGTSQADLADSRVTSSVSGPADQTTVAASFSNDATTEADWASQIGGLTGNAFDALQEQSAQASLGAFAQAAGNSAESLGTAAYPNAIEAPAELAEVFSPATQPADAQRVESTGDRAAEARLARDPNEFSPQASAVEVAGTMSSLSASGGNLPSADLPIAEDALRLSAAEAPASAASALSEPNIASNQSAAENISQSSDRSVLPETRARTTANASNDANIGSTASDSGTISDSSTTVGETTSASEAATNVSGPSVLPPIIASAPTNVTSGVTASSEIRLSSTASEVGDQTAAIAPSAGIDPSDAIAQSAANDPSELSMHNAVGAVSDPGDQPAALAPSEPGDQAPATAAIDPSTPEAAAEPPAEPPANDPASSLARAAAIARADPTMHGTQFAGPPGGIQGLLEKFAHMPRPQLAIHVPLPPVIAALIEKIPVRLRPIVAGVLALLVAGLLFVLLRPHGPSTHPVGEKPPATDNAEKAKKKPASAEKSEAAKAEKPKEKESASAGEAAAKKPAAKPEAGKAEPAEGAKPESAKSEKAAAPEKEAKPAEGASAEKAGAVPVEVLPKQLSSKELKIIRAFVPATCSIHGEKLTQWNFNSGYLLCIVKHNDGPATYVLQRETDGFTFIGGSEEAASLESLTALGVPDPVAKTLLAHLQK